MGAIDPTYPLYPLACCLACVGLVLVLLSSFVRQNWNLGVAFLCFWLLVGNLIDAINAIIWSDNREVKFYTYCDIVSHLRLVIFVVRPMATLIIIRRLYIIADLQSVELSSRAMHVRNLIIEWTLGLLIPAIVAGPLYYVNQLARFQVIEGFGCVDSYGDTIVGLLTLDSWTIVPPLLSIIIYYPRVARIFYKQGRAGNKFSRSVGSVSRAHYFRILALASVDILIILPMGITNLVISITLGMEAGESIPWYYGWSSTHAGTGTAASIPYADLQAVGPSQVASTYFEQWTSPILAFAVFGLFGLTTETRATYWRMIHTVGGWCGWKSEPDTGYGGSQLATMEFRGQQLEAHTLTYDAEMATTTTVLSRDLTLSRDVETQGENGIGEEAAKGDNDCLKDEFELGQKQKERDTSSASSTSNISEDGLS